MCALIGMYVCSKLERMHTYTCRYVHICTHTCMHTHSACIHTNTHTHTHMHTYTYARMHTHTHMHTHTNQQERVPPCVVVVMMWSGWIKLLWRIVSTKNRHDLAVLCLVWKMSVVYSSVKAWVSPVSYCVSGSQSVLRHPQHQHCHHWGLVSSDTDSS